MDAQPLESRTPTTPPIEVASEPRFRLRPDVPNPTIFEGAWWPRSPVLTAEVPGLIASLSDTVGQVAIVGYHLKGWDPAPSHIQVDDRTVQLQGFTADDPASVILIGTDGRRITLLAIPPDAGPQVAQQQLEDASRKPLSSTTILREAERVAARSVAEVATRLAAHEGTGDPQRAAEIARWAEQAAQQFTNATTQTYVPILVEHIVRNRMNGS